MGRPPSWQSCCPRFRKRWPWAASCVVKARGDAAVDGALRPSRVGAAATQARKHCVVAFALLLTLSTACAGPQQESVPDTGAPPRPSRTLTMAVKYEVPDLAPKIP